MHLPRRMWGASLKCSSSSPQVRDKNTTSPPPKCFLRKYLNFRHLDDCRLSVSLLHRKQSFALKLVIPRVVNSREDVGKPREVWPESGRFSLERWIMAKFMVEVNWENKQAAYSNKLKCCNRQLEYITGGSSNNLQLSDFSSLYIAVFNAGAKEILIIVRIIVILTLLGSSLVQETC